MTPTHTYHGLNHSLTGWLCIILRTHRGKSLIQLADGTKAIVPTRCLRRHTPDKGAQQQP